MTAYRFMAFRRALLRTRLAARAREDRGDTLIEVLIAALLVALVAGAVLTGFVSVAHISGDQRKHAEAAALAQQDEERMRGLTITQLAASGAGTGNWSSTNGARPTVLVDGTAYSVASSAQYTSGTGATSCTAGSASTSADEVATTSTVSWSPSNGRPPVVVHGLVTPGIGGSLIASVTTFDASGATVGLPGVTVSISGPSTVPPLVTDSNGCAIFGGLSGGSYTVSMTPPAGYVDANGATTIADQTVTVTPTRTAPATAGPLGLAGAISATFTTAFNGQSNVAATADQMTFVNNSQSRTFGTDSTASNNTFVGSITTGLTMFPWPTAYSAFAGGCDNPPPSGAAGLVSATVTGGQTTNVTLPEPAMIVLPYTTSSGIVDDRDPTLSYSGSGTSPWTQTANASAYAGTEDDSNTNTATKVTFSFNGTAVAWLAKTATNLGKASVSLDGGAATTVDLYSSSTLNQQVVYSAYGLAAGNHTLTVKVLNTKNASSTATNIDIDAFEYGTPVFADDRSAALSYSSGWNQVANGSDYSGTESDSTTSTATTTATFVGDGVQLIARRAGNLGIASVSLDGGAAKLVDLYSSSTAYQQAVYSVYGLTPGTHTLAITATGTKNAASSASAIDVDAIDYNPAGNEDDRDSALAYSSGWTQAANTSDFAGTESDSNTSTATKVTATFTGSAVAWIAKTASNLGKATVSVDGGAATTVDLYSSSTLYQQTVWKTGNLAPGTHTLTITVTNTRNASSSGTTIDVDAILPMVLLSTQPNVTVTDTDAACANNEDYPPEQVPTATGGALVSPGLPYGTYTVCVDNGANHDTVTSFANTNYGTTGNILSAYLYTGAPGFGSGVCT